MTSDDAHVSDRCGTMMGGVSGQGTAWGPRAAGCGTTSGGSTDPVALGEHVFDSGIGANGQPIARTGGTGMMASSGCAACHGLDGHGRTTMMFKSPNVTYANLTDPSGMLDPDGSRGPTYTDALIRRAVVEGVGADGQALSPAMPRWQLGDQDWADLLAYLETLP
jgi:mono/diheme cytochrome c family protein